MRFLLEFITLYYSDGYEFWLVITVKGRMTVWFIYTKQDCEHYYLNMNDHSWIADGVKCNF